MIQIQMNAPLLRQIIALFLCSVISIALPANDVGINADKQLIQKQFIEYYNALPANDLETKKLINELKSDGTWPDLDYENQRRGSWPALKHLKRLLILSRAYRHPKSNYYHEEALLKTILNCLSHWLEKDYTNPNWWHNQIGIPDNMLKTLILLGDQLPDTMLKIAQEQVLPRTKMGMTGQNKVWLAGCAFMKAFLANDPAFMKTASDTIWSELVVSTLEGIQPDWSFHQHGPQQQFGNYGRSFGESLVLWAYVLRGSSYAAPDQQLEILGNYIAEGPAWMLWKGKMDLNACGRQFTAETPGNPAINYADTREQLQRMIKIDPANASKFRAALADKKPLVGHKSFWRTDMAVHRQKDWYASLKMSSSRVIGAETANSENVLGIHQGDGVLLLYQSGKEFIDIAPLWDWHRLPGSTCDQGMDDLIPKGWNSSYGDSDFAGVLSNGKVGMAAMLYKRNDLAARKAWFFTSNGIVCLGTGISGETKGEVYTSVQQDHVLGPIISANGILQKGTHQFKKDSWIHHNNIGYQLLDNAICDIRTVKGNWLSCYPAFSDRPAAGDIFSIWLNHGQNPQNQSYSYIVHPNAEQKQMAKIIRNHKTIIISNTKNVQAIKHKKSIQAVFYSKGVLNFNKTSISVDSPCLLMYDKKQIWVSDPLQNATEITIKINDKPYTFQMPQGDEKGKQLRVYLKNP